MFYQDVPDINYVQQDVAIAKQGVELIMSQNSQIDSFCALIWQNSLLLGVIPKPLYSRSQRDALKSSIIADVSDAYGFDEILVSFDIDIFYEITKLDKSTLPDDENLAKLFYSVKIRR